VKIDYVLTREPGWKGLTGHVDSQMIKNRIPDYKDRIFYICGPPAMNDALKRALQELQMPAEQIRLEEFTGY
jgi:NAD(P)H-flavin reductase